VPELLCRHKPSQELFYKDRNTVKKLLVDKTMQMQIDGVLADLTEVGHEWP